MLSIILINMKAIQFTVDEDLLRRMDADPEVKAKGRSAFLRRAIAEYLQRKREAAIREAYRRGYGGDPPADGEFDVAPERWVWPDE
jgi:hypothetical protein